MKRFPIAAIFAAAALAFTLAACGAKQEAAAPQPAAEPTPAVEEPAESTDDIVEEESEAMLQMMIGEVPVTVEWESNESVEALRALCADSPLVIQLSMYGGFEQVGPIGATLPSSDVQTTTASGDIVLYSSNQIVVFYGSNSWAYTRLGHIVDQNADAMAALLGNGNVTITLSVE